MRDSLGKFIKGSNPPKTAFKKGIIPWNKGKKGFKGFWKGKKMSKKHRKNLSIAHLGQIAWNKEKKFLQIIGSKHHNWKGGKILNGKGYIIIKKRNHPFCNKQGYILEHRFIMEKKIRRFLKKNEIVHHIDQNTLNNNPENLMLFPNHSEHIKHHAYLRRLNSRM